MDVISYGEVMLRFTPERFRTFVASNSWNVEVGGTEANVLINLSLLGVSTSFITFFPDNFLGYKAYCELRKYGVGVEKTRLVSYGRMGMYFVEFHHRSFGIQVIYDRKDSAFSLTPLSEEDLEYFRRAKLIHLTGITPSLSDVCRDNQIKILKSKGGNQKISFDVNFRKKLWEEEDFKRYLKEVMDYIDILFIKKEDYNILFSNEEDEEKILHNLQKDFGEEKIFVLTKGEEGATAIYKGEMCSVSSYNTDIVDRIGAGDAFTAGFLYGYLNNKDLKECVDLGNILASVKMSVFGDFISVDRRTLEQFLENSIRSVER